MVFVAALVDKRAEHALFLLEQLTRLAKLDDVSSVENHLVDEELAAGRTLGEVCSQFCRSP